MQYVFFISSDVGSYQCQATNRVGTATSEKITLDILRRLMLSVRVLEK